MKYFNILLLSLVLIVNGYSQFTQEGPKLVGTNYIGTTFQGAAVAMSADGNTVLVASSYDNNNTGAVWVYTRSNGVWSQQGEKLVASDAVIWSSFGSSVSLSADGNTALIGGSLDNTSVGAAWIFKRVNGVWTQQGPKIVPVDNNGPSYFGNSVSISADGNTAVVGGSRDNNFNGAFWVLKCINGVWGFQGAKIIGDNLPQWAYLGYSVSISGDGNTILAGAPSAGDPFGGVCVFVQSNGTWIQQGPSFISPEVHAFSSFGRAVSLSYDGNTALIGASTENGNVGGAWVFTRSNGIWSQQGSKLIGDAMNGHPNFGFSVSIAADGNTAFIGAPVDNNNIGASWAFSRTNGVWTQLDYKIIGTGYVNFAAQGIAVSLSADGHRAIVGGYADNVSTGAAWIFNSPSPDGSGTISAAPSPAGINTPHSNFTFTYTAAPGGMKNGEIDITMPATWSGGAVSSSAGISVFNAGTIKVTGIYIDCGNTLTINLTNCTTGINMGANVFPAKTKSKAGGTLTSVASNPFVLLTKQTAPDGSGTITVIPAAAYTNTIDQNYMFTYTADIGGLYDGEIDIAIPAGWNVGAAASSIGAAAIVGGVIKVTGIFLDGGSLFTIYMTNTTTGNNPGANIFPVSTKSKIIGALTPMEISPVISLIGRNNGNSTLSFLFPVGGENLTGGTYYYLQWKRNIGLVAGPFRLEYSTDGGNTWITINTSPIAGVTRFAWLIPNINALHCKIRISNYLTGRVYCESNYFSISSGSGRAQNYPNPFNPTTKIKFTLEKSSFTSLKIYNSIGQLVSEMVNKQLEAGFYEYEFNAANMPSGVYYYKLSREGKSEINKMLLLK